MPSVAEQLHLARESKKLTVYQVAEVTKIRTDHIRALEEGNFNAFSAPVYIRGFVRTYATLLKLDVAHVMATLDAELGQTEKFREPPPLVEERRTPLDFVMLQLSKLNWRAARLLGVAAVALVLVITAIALWHHQQRADPLANLGQGVYQPSPSSSSGEVAPLPAPPPAGRQ
jgi:cytoskeletal protein RodZ